MAGIAYLMPKNTPVAFTTFGMRRADSRGSKKICRAACNVS
jgi:hypothetical protein